jgi:hypothetical protein
MAIAVIQEFESTLEDYDKVNQKVGETPAPGLIVHAIADLGGDRWKVVDLWGSKEQYDDFVQNTLVPAIAEVNPDAPQAPEPDILEVRDLLKG